MSASEDTLTAPIEGDRALLNRAAVDLMQNGRLRLIKGAAAGCYANTVVILRGFLGHRLTYNEMSEQPELDGATVTEWAIGAFRCTVDELFSYSPSLADARGAFLQVASERRFHPVRRYLEGLPAWDLTRRWSALPSGAFGVENPSPIMGIMLERWGISAVARAFQPGAQVDHVLVLQGPPALRKSTFFRVLGGEWFGEGDVETGIEGVRAMSRKWIWCWDELAGMSRRERAALDGFITRKEDQLRPLFRDYIDHPRTTVLTATANPEQIFDNPEGLRRWWLVPVRRRMGETEIADMRDQLWAEALYRYRAHERWYLDGPEEETAHAIHLDDYRIVGPWDAKLATWIASEACKLLSHMGGRAGWFSVDDALDALDIPLKERSHAKSSECGAALRRIGCKPVPGRPRLHGAKVSAYIAPGKEAG